MHGVPCMYMLAVWPYGSGVGRGEGEVVSGFLPHRFITVLILITENVSFVTKLALPCLNFHPALHSGGCPLSPCYKFNAVQLLCGDVKRVVDFGYESQS